MVDKMHYQSLYKAFIQLGEFDKVPSVVPVQQIKVQAESISTEKECLMQRKLACIGRSSKVKSN